VFPKKPTPIEAAYDPVLDAYAASLVTMIATALDLVLEARKAAALASARGPFTAKARERLDEACFSSYLAGRGVELALAALDERLLEERKEIDTTTAKRSF
jgi:hypothetical protein